MKIRRASREGLMKRTAGRKPHHFAWVKTVCVDEGRSGASRLRRRNG
jgi:hypothetical protein